MALPEMLSGRLSLPVLASPMFIVSGPELVIEQCKAGIIGSFPALNARPQSALREWIRRIKSELAAYAEAHPERPVAPFAVNQICHVSNDRLKADMEVCVEEQVPIIITSLRPPAELVEAAHSYGGLVFHDVINQRHARKAAEQGVDGLILVSAGAGGHAGSLSPFALLREVKSWFDGTVILSGAISDGASVAGAIAMGADLAYMGTRFIATQEANSDQRYRDMLVRGSADDVVYSSLFTGVHGNYLKASVAEAGYDPDKLPEGDPSKMDFGSGGNTEKKVWKDILGSGQGIGGIRDVPPVSELAARLRREFNDAAARFSGIAEKYRD
ncbi:NAD(P)H-dependent flavin oxidoreductase [Isoalcanivorax indicus]|uniref:NAD(P)H-dependent flavin oxidoreductase n=1 Tax=Isoalcanivorax indicus TaxID=2202653 RepID=UPI000DB914C1|nr:nitronate monooxygenase family protein [Isoalcanivorax indicus]